MEEVIIFSAFTFYVGLVTLLKKSLNVWKLHTLLTCCLWRCNVIPRKTVHYLREQQNPLVLMCSVWR